MAELDRHPRGARPRAHRARTRAPGRGRLPCGGLGRRMVPAILKARRALAMHRTQVLLGLGGFTTAPAALAARSLGIPVVLLEINATAGKATRALGPLCQRVLHAWRETLPPGREGQKHQLVGPPVSPGFKPPTVPDREQAEAKDDLGFDPARPLLVVLGGSQGARGLNAFIRQHVSFLLGSGVQVLHQVGPGRRTEGADDLEGYAAVEFLDDVRLALVAAVTACSAAAEPRPSPRSARWGPWRGRALSAPRGQPPGPQRPPALRWRAHRGRAGSRPRPLRGARALPRRARRDRASDDAPPSPRGGPGERGAAGLVRARGAVGGPGPLVAGVSA